MTAPRSHRSGGSVRSNAGTHWGLAYAHALLVTITAGALPCAGRSPTKESHPPDTSLHTERHRPSRRFALDGSPRRAVHAARLDGAVGLRPPRAGWRPVAAKAAAEAAATAAVAAATTETGGRWPSRPSVASRRHGVARGAGPTARPSRQHTGEGQRQRRRSLPSLGACRRLACRCPEQGLWDRRPRNFQEEADEHPVRLWPPQPSPPPRLATATWWRDREGHPVPCKRRAQPPMPATRARGEIGGRRCGRARGRRGQAGHRPIHCQRRPQAGPPNRAGTLPAARPVARVRAGPTTAGCAWRPASVPVWAPHRGSVRYPLPPRRSLGRTTRNKKGPREQRGGCVTRDGGHRPRRGEKNNARLGERPRGTATPQHSRPQPRPGKEWRARPR